NNLPWNLYALQILRALEVSNGHNNTRRCPGVTWPQDLHVKNVEARICHVLESHPLILDVYFHRCVTAFDRLYGLLVSKYLRTSDIALELVRGLQVGPEHQ